MTSKIKELENRVKASKAEASGSSSNNNNNNSLKVEAATKLIGALERYKQDPSAILLSELEMKDIIDLIGADLKDFSAVYSGGMSPIMRWTHFMSKWNMNDLKWFIATTSQRGNALHTYAKKNDASAQNIRTLLTKGNIKDAKSSGSSGSHSVISTKVTLSPFFILYRDMKGRDSYQGNEYAGDCPVRYQWLGSMASMYDPSEESEPLAAAIQYAVWYEDYQDWYVARRAAAAGGGRRNKGESEEEHQKKVKNSKDYSRRYYFIALSSFSRKCREAWSKKNYIKPEAGNAYVEQAKFLETLAVVLQTSVDDINNSVVPGKTRLQQ